MSAATSIDGLAIQRSPSHGPHAIIIGSGFGGLAAAIRLGVRGYRVTVLERRSQLGGRASVHHQDGFTFDAGPTVVTAPYLFEELWALCGRNFRDEIDLRPVTPYYRIRFDDGELFDYCGDPELMRRQIEALSPADVQGYARFLDLSRSIFEVGYEQLADVPFDTVGSMLKIAPDMMKLQSYRTVYGLVSKYIQHEKLRQILSFHTLLVGGNPFTTTSIYALICFLERKWGVHFPIGGTGVLVRGMADLIRGLGGQILCDADVRSISTQGGRATGVELADGQRIASDIVVSNADAAWTYRHLLDHQRRRRWTHRKLDRSKYSMSLFVWYFGTRRRYDHVAHHTILLGPRYRDLLRDIFDRKVLSEDFSLYLHRPTATDPTLAPQGCDGFYVLSPVPNLQGNVDWATAEEPYRRGIARYLSDSILPDLEANVVTSRVLTPPVFQDDLLSYRGAAFSFEPVLTQSAWFRPHNRSEEISNLYLVGAGTHPGAGLPGVLTSAKILDRVVPNADHFDR